MAGWLFADLMLVLFLIGLGAQPTAYPAQATATVPATKPKPTPTPTRPPALSKHPVKMEVRTSKDVSKQVRSGLKKHGLGGDHAGMVLVWGDHQVIKEGQRIARGVAKKLPKINRPFFGDATIRILWSGRGQSDLVTLEIYILR